MDATLNDKVPPHNIEAEQAVLGALLLNWSAMAEVVSSLRPDRFYSLQNQVIYEAMVKLYTKSATGDTISLINELTVENKLEQAGGAAYIASLTDTVPSAANIDYYANMVLDRAARRDLIHISSELKASSFDLQKESDSLLDEAEQKIFALAEKNETTQIYSAQNIMVKEIELIEARYKSKNQFTGVPTGFAKLDTYTSGFQDSELIIIGARFSHLKCLMNQSVCVF